MKKTLTASVVIAALALVFAGRVAGTPGLAAMRADQLRTIYFSATDSKGGFVTDLTAADLAVKEGGKVYPIAGVKSATEPMQVSILVDDGGQGIFQQGLASFLNATMGHGQFAISMLTPQVQKIANYIEDSDGLKAALMRLGQRAKITPDGEQIIEGVGEAAKELHQRKAARPVIVVLTLNGEMVLSDRADPALNDLKASGASLNVVYITSIQLGKVLGDGPKQSGGIIEQAGSGPAITGAVTKISDNLMHQYVLTYNIPDGTKLNEKLQLTTTRKGITIIAPSRLPDK